MSEYGSVQFRLPTKNEVKVCAAFNQEEGVVNLYLYLDARAVMEILDDAVGQMNWDRTHECIGGKVYCSIGINVNYDHPDRPRCMVTKMDVGTKTPIEKEKGESSDSFKRAAVSWGIGRALYYAPDMTISSGDCLIGKDNKVLTKFEVRDISFSEDRRGIRNLVIVEQQTGEMVYAIEDFRQVVATAVNIPSAHTASPTANDLHTASPVENERHTAEREVSVGAEMPAPRMEQNTSKESQVNRPENRKKPVSEPVKKKTEVSQRRPVSEPVQEPPVCSEEYPFEPVCASENSVPFDAHDGFEVERPEMTEAVYEQKAAELEALKAEMNRLLDQKIGVTVKKDKTFREVWRNDQFINYLLRKFTPVDAATQAVKDTVTRLAAHAKIVEMVL